MDAHDEIHGVTAPTIETGVKVDAAVVASNEAKVAATAATGSGDEAGRPGQDVGIAAFGLYWHAGEKRYKCFSPTVMDRSGNAVTVTEPVNPYSIGTYNLYVSKDSSNSTYTAEIALNNTVVVDSDTLAVIKLFTIGSGPGDTKQFHTGAYVIPDQDFKLIRGDDTNVVFTPITSGANAGKIKIDVYYK